MYSLISLIPPMIPHTMNMILRLLLLLVLPCTAATAQTWDWAASLCSGYDYDPFLTVDFVESDARGNVYVLVRVPDSLVVYSTSGEQAWPFGGMPVTVLLKYDSLGGLCWGQRISHQLTSGPGSMGDNITGMAVSRRGEVFLSGSFGRSQPSIDTLYLYGAAGTQAVLADAWHSFDVGAGIYSGLALGLLMRYENDGRLGEVLALDARGDATVADVAMVRQSGDTTEWLAVAASWIDTLVFQGQILDGGPQHPRRSSTLLLSLTRDLGVRWYRRGVSTGDDVWGGIETRRVGGDAQGRSYALVQARDTAVFDGLLVPGEPGFIFVPLSSLLLCYDADGQLRWSRHIDQQGYSEQVEDLDVSPQGTVWLLIQSQGHDTLHVGGQALQVDPDHPVSLLGLADGGVGTLVPASVAALPGLTPRYRVAAGSDQTVYVAQEIANYFPLRMRSSDGNDVPVRTEANFSSNTLLSRYTSDGRLVGLLKVGHVLGNQPATLSRDAAGRLLVAVEGGGTRQPGGGMPFGSDSAGCGGGSGGFVARLDGLYNLAEAENFSVPSFVCAGDTLWFRFYTLDRRSPGRTYTLEMSDAAGSFAQPRVLGSQTTGAFLDSIAWVYPANLPAGDQYRFRVVPADAGQTVSMPFSSGFGNNLFTIRVPDMQQQGDSLVLWFPVGADPYTFITWFDPAGQTVAQGTADFLGELPASVRAIKPASMGVYRVVYQPSCVGEVRYEYLGTPIDPAIPAWHVYPNPATTRFIVEGLPPGATLMLYDLAGRAVVLPVQTTAAGATVSLPGRLATGVYLLRATAGAATAWQRLHIVR
ncbi:MAG: hypothetical protein OHK0039_42310 [Bacteroidia bacterium]